MIVLPERLDRMQTGLFSVLGDALAPAQVGWAYGQAAFENMPGDLVSLALSSGPVPRVTQVQGSVILPFDSLTLKVGAVTANQRLGVSVNEINFFRDVSGLDTPSTVAAGLLAQLGADPEHDPWTVAPGLAADELVLTPNSFGAVWRVRLLGPVTAPASTASGSAALLSECDADCTITAQTFSKQREPYAGAWALASRLLAALRARDYVDTLYTYGVTLGALGAPSDISALSGGNWESRCTLDFGCVLRSAFARPVDTITSVVLGLDLSGPGGGAFAPVVTTINNP